MQESQISRKSLSRKIATDKNILFFYVTIYNNKNLNIKMLYIYQIIL